MKIVKKLHLGKLATFEPNRGLPIHNWFPYKEAFSRDLVVMLAKSFYLFSGDSVLDPFCGVGTTPLACKELGVNCVGYDVHPLMLFVSRVKLRDYDAGKMREAVRRFISRGFERPKEFLSSIEKFFPKSVLEDVCFFREKAMEIEDEITKEFLLFGLVSAALECSWAYKNGAVIKVRKRKIPPFRGTIERRLGWMCDDVERFGAKRTAARVEHRDARKLGLADESVDAIITSPPYLNKLEYISAYRIDQELLGLDPPSPKELIGVREEGVVEDFSGIEELVEGKPLEAKLYFKDMFAAIHELYRVCKPGARVALVTSDACTPKGVIEVCIPLSELAERAGFRAKRMLVVNRRFCTTPARKKIGITQEGLLLWEK